MAMAQDEGIVDCGVLCEVMSHIDVTTKHVLLMKQFNWHLLGVGSGQSLEICSPFVRNSEYKCQSLTVFKKKSQQLTVNK